MPSPKTIAAAGSVALSPALAYEMHLSTLLGGVQADRALVDDVLFSTESLQRWGDAFSQTTLDLLKSRAIDNPSWKTRHVDVVRDVINLVPIRFLATEIVRTIQYSTQPVGKADDILQLGLPLKTETNEGGVYRDEELYQMFRDASE
jgi:linoleate 10R-lipoxygenase